jgi:hypothetical protein
VRRLALTARNDTLAGLGKRGAVIWRERVFNAARQWS